MNDIFNSKVKTIAEANRIPKHFIPKFKKKLLKYGIKTIADLENADDEVAQRLHFEEDNLHDIHTYLKNHNPIIELSQINYFSVRLKNKKVVFSHLKTLLYFSGDFFREADVDIIKRYAKSKDDSLLDDYEVQAYEFSLSLTKVEKEWLNLDAVNRLTSIKKDRLTELIKSGKIKANPTKKSFLINSKEIKRIKAVQDKWMSLLDTINQRSQELEAKYGSIYIEHRQKLMRYLEENDFFGVHFYKYENIEFNFFINLKKAQMYKDDLFLLKNDKDKLFAGVDVFLIIFDRKNEELIENLRLFHITKNTKARLKYDEFLKYEVPVTKKHHAMVYLQLMMADKELYMMTNDELMELAMRCKTKNEKITLARFSTYLKNKQVVGYTPLSVTKSTFYTMDTDAYPLKQIASMAKAIFDKVEYKENHIVEKAFESDFICQTWLYVSVLFITGWRSSDILKNWKYLDGIDIEDFEMKAKLDRLPVAELLKAANILISKIELNPTYPSKTGIKASGCLTAAMTEGMKEHFGLIMLILAHHEKNGNKGQLVHVRRNDYARNETLVSIFGQYMRDGLNDNNLLTRKMNKFYLQGIEKISRNQGDSPLTSYTIAAQARNHKINNLLQSETTNIYLRDGAFTGETIELISHEICERGVLGFVPYLFLESCFDNFNALTTPDQTKLIQSIHLSPLEINVLIHMKFQLDEISDNYFQKLDFINSYKRRETNAHVLIKLQDLKQSNLLTTANTLMAYHAIGNGYGFAKEDGNYCLLRAINMACAMPTQKDCTHCPYCVITKIGVQSVFKRYSEALKRYNDKLNPKDLMVINTIIKPAINELATFIYDRLDKKEQQQFIYLIASEKERIEDKVKRKEY
ncbi:hypothetical protein [Acetobacterium sp.]|uniref:hypothetical protein n=1 Tax=Acetobacterium sp. TaxID=1872094 RepID=UPI002F3E4CDE